MAEAQKEPSSSADPKQRTPLPDDGIGKEFLSSWKSMSVAEGDPLDFNFDIDTGAKGKATAFKFSKMDMDFDFDGDFGKISSFKVDMSDLDFSPKKTGKTKEQSGEDSVNKNHQGKQDKFTFSFDFNDLDSFNFEPRLTKAEKKSSKGVSVDKSVCQDTRKPVSEDIDVFDDGIAIKLPTFEMAATSKADTLVGGPGNLDSTNDNGSSETANFENRCLSDEAGTCVKKVRFGVETDRQSPPSEKTISADPYDHQGTLDLPVQYVYEDETHSTVSELKMNKISQDSKVNDISGGEQIINAKMKTESGSNHECSQFDGSSPPHITISQSHDTERNKLGCNDSIPSENVDDTRPERCDFEDIVSTKALNDTERSSENKNSASELGLTPLKSGQMLDKLITLKEKTNGANESMYFKRTEETSQLHQASSTQTQVLSLGSKNIGAVHFIPPDEKREEFDANDATTGEKLVGCSSPESPEFAKVESVFLGSEKVENVNTAKDDLDADRSQSRISIVVSSSRPHVQEVTRSETVLLGSERSVKDLNTFSGQILDKLIPLNEKATGAIESKYFRKTEETSQLHQASSTQTKVLPPGSKRIGAVHLIPADGKSEEFDANDATTGKKLVGTSSSGTPEFAKVESVLLGSIRNVQNVNTTKDDLDADRSQSRVSKVVSTSRPHVQEVTRSETVLLGSERSVKDLNTFSGQILDKLIPLNEKATGAIGSKYFMKTEEASQLHQASSTQTKVLPLGSKRIGAVHLIPADEKSLQVDPLCSIKQIAKSSAQKCVDPRPLVPNMGSIKKLKTVSVEGNKLLGVKALSRIPKPSSLRILRDTGVRNILSNSPFGKEIESLRKSEQNIELEGKTKTKMMPSVETEKKTPPTPSLKRKALEAQGSLNPQKRLSESPSESRKLKESSEVILKDQVCNQDTKNVLNSVLDIPREMNMSEPDISLAMENDQNVKKAQAYSKDLEDICNMLKKKHEEAKEILVRAIVNNNNLLMLNHPMYEAKIHAIQKFAAQIMSKNLQV